MHKIKQLEACKRLLKIEISSQEIAVAYEEIYKQIQKEVALPGFRKGNAPLELIKEAYKDYAKKHVLERLVEESYRDAIKESGFLPVGMPKIENLKFPDDSSLSFDAIVEIRPEISVKDYKGLKIKKKDTKLKEEDIDSALENLRQIGLQYKTIPARPAKEGDFLLCDLEWFVENKSIDKKEKVILPVEKNALTQDMFNGILGANVGEKKSISINIDKGFPKQEYVGKSAVLDIYVHELKQKELPKLDDEFAKALGVAGGLKDLRAQVEVRLNLEKEQTVHNDMENQIIEQLLKNHSFDLPSSLVESELEGLLEDSRQRLFQQGYAEKDVKEIMEKEKDAMLKKLRPHAEKQVKTFFLIEEIAKAENIDPTEEEVNNLIENLAKRRNQPPVRLKEELEKENKINSLYWQLAEAKVMGFLLDNAKIEEEVQKEVSRQSSK